MMEVILVATIWFTGAVITAMGYVWYQVRIEGCHHTIPLDEIIAVALFWYVAIPIAIIVMGISKLTRKWERYLRSN